MSYLYIDASYSLSVGLLNSNWEWELYKTTSDLPSVALHKTVQEFIKGKSWAEINGVFFCKGPGSYTGLRLIEGFSQFLNFENINCLDFYSFELRDLLNIDESFLYPAFKGQYLVYKESGSLIEKQELDLDLKYFGDGLSDNIKSTSIIKLIEQESKEIFPKLLGSQNKEIYYFRPLSEEFKK